jgi:hypothetical protein
MLNLVDAYTQLEASAMARLGSALSIIRSTMGHS